jgi:hypothetical protein
VSPSPNSSPARWSPNEMPSEDPTIGPFEDAVVSWAQTPGSETLDWTPSLAPPHSREPEGTLPDLCPSPEPDANGRRAIGARTPALLC